MRLVNPLDLIVVDRNRLWDSALEDRTSPFFQADQRIRAASQFLRGLMAETQGLAHDYPELDRASLEHLLREASDSLEAQPDADGLQQLGRRVCGSLRRYAEQQEALVAEREAEVQRILTLVSVSLRRSADQSSATVAHLEVACTQMEQVARLDDLRQVRASLAENIRLMRRVIETAAEAGPGEELTREVEALRQRLNEVEEVASRDALTGVYNRRAFMARLERGLTGGEPFCLVMCDLDHFKNINDTLGHLAGDECLRRAAKQLQALFRSSDVVARLGGDEFVVLVTGLPAAEVAQCVEEHFPASLLWAYPDGPAGHKRSVSYSASFGITDRRPGDTARTMQERADQCLYRAKRSVDNRVIWE